MKRHIWAASGFTCSVMCSAHTQRWEMGRQLCLSLIFQYFCAVIGLFHSPQGLSVWRHILGTGTINIGDPRVFIMQFIMSVLGCCGVPMNSTAPPVFAPVMLHLHNWRVAIVERADTNLQWANVGHYIGMAILSNQHCRLDVFVLTSVDWDFSHIMVNTDLKVEIHRRLSCKSTHLVLRGGWNTHSRTIFNYCLAASYFCITLSASVNTLKWSPLVPFPEYLKTNFTY